MHMGLGLGITRQQSGQSGPSAPAILLSSRDELNAQSYLKYSGTQAPGYVLISEA